VLKEQHYYSRPWINAAQWVFRYKRFASAIGGGARGDDVSVAGDATPDYIWANLRFLNTAYVSIRIRAARKFARAVKGPGVSATSARCARRCRKRGCTNCVVG